MVPGGDVAHRFKGKEVFYADHFEFHPDPVSITKSRSGLYTLKSRLYRGRRLVYRAAGELPSSKRLPLGGKSARPCRAHGWIFHLETIEDQQAAGVYRSPPRRRVDPQPVLRVDSLPSWRKGTNNASENAQRQSQIVTG